MIDLDPVDLLAIFADRSKIVDDSAQDLPASVGDATRSRAQIVAEQLMKRSWKSRFYQGHDPRSWFSCVRITASNVTANLLQAR